MASALTRKLIEGGLQPEVSPFGIRAYEVVVEGHQVAVFRARGCVVTNPKTGRPMELEPTSEALAQAKAYAELFIAALSGRSAKPGRAA